MLVSAELFLNCDYYGSYPLFKEKYDLNPDLFACVNSVFSICVSDHALESFTVGSSRNDCIKQEAINNCNLGSWSSMLCVIASSNLLNRKIRSHYPIIGESRICHVLNSTLTPRNVTTEPPIDILWTRCDIAENDFKSNHFVPLFLISGNDYKKNTSKKISKQLYISNKYKQNLEQLGKSTKKGKSVNFRMDTNSIRQWFPTFTKDNSFQNVNISKQTHPPPKKKVANIKTF